MLEHQVGLALPFGKPAKPDGVGARWRMAQFQARIPAITPQVVIEHPLAIGITDQDRGIAIPAVGTIFGADAQAVIVPISSVVS